MEKSGEHKNELDLFEKGIKPLVDVVRILSLETESTEISTRRRLRELAKSGRVPQGEDIEQLVEYLSTLLIHDQLQQIDEGLLPDSFINPDSLSELERKTLKEAFLLISEMYDKLEKNIAYGKDGLLTV